jgi:hypothetical protein
VTGRNVLTEDDTPALQAAMQQAREHPGEPAPVAGTDVTVTWHPGEGGNGVIAYSAGVLHLGGSGKDFVEIAGKPDPAEVPIWDLP